MSTFPENLSATSYFISQKSFVRLKNLKIKLPNGNITNFDWDKTYIINAINATGKVVDFDDTDTQYQNIDNTLHFTVLAEPDGNDKGAVWGIYVYNLQDRLAAGNTNITLDKILDHDQFGREFYRVTIASKDTTYSVDDRLTQLTGNNVITLLPGENGQVLSTTLVGNELSAGWTTPPTYSKDDTTYDDGRFIQISGTTNTINTTLDGDNKFIKIDEDGIIQLIPSSNSETFALLSQSGKIIWKQVGECSNDTPTTVDDYSLNFSNKTISLLKNGTAINSYNLPFKEYYADNNTTTNPDNPQCSTLILYNQKQFSVYDIHTRLSSANEATLKILSTANGITVISASQARDGRDGIDGTNGTNGRDGVDGKDGMDGIFADLQPPPNNGNMYVLSGKQLNGVFSYGWCAVSACQ